MAALSTGSNGAQTGYNAPALAAISGALGSYRQEAAVAIDVDGGVGVPVVHVGGLLNVSINGVNGANAGALGGLPAGCLKGTQGRVAKVLVTAAGTAQTNIYDNAAGTATGVVIGIIPASPTVGTVYTFDMPANTGISVPAVASTSTFTLGYS
jgi:hypothetical protein